MAKKTKKVFVSIIVGFITLGLVAAYIPLLFLRSEQIPQAPQQREEQIIVPLTPTVPQNESTSTQAEVPNVELEGFTEFGAETGLLDNLNSLLEESGN